MQRSGREIVADCLLQKQRLLLAILRDEPDAVPDRIERRADRHGPAIDQDRARGERIGPEDRPREFRAAGADQTRDPQDFARPDLEIDAVELWSAAPAVDERCATP